MEQGKLNKKLGSKLFGVIKIRGKTIGTTIFEVKFLWGSETEWSVCAMGQRGPPFAYVVYYYLLGGREKSILPN